MKISKFIYAAVVGGGVSFVPIGGYSYVQR